MLAIRLFMVVLGLLGEPLRAEFTGPSSAHITWTQPWANVRTCLVRYYGAEYPSGICWDTLPAGEFSVDLPGSYTPVEAYTPKPGDKYEVWRGNVAVETAYLGTRPVYSTYLPIVRKGSGTTFRYLLPVIRS